MRNEVAQGKLFVEQGCSPPTNVAWVRFQPGAINYGNLFGFWFLNLLLRSTLEPLISLHLVGTKFYCFRARLHCYYCLYNIFSANTVRRSEELWGGPLELLHKFFSAVYNFPSSTKTNIFKFQISVRIVQYTLKSRPLIGTS